MDKHTLYGIDKKGGVKEWSVWTEDDTIFVTHGKLGGKMKGTHEFRDFNVQKGLIGEWINFTYQDTSVDGVPTFPVGVVVREMKNGTPVY